MRHDPGTRAFGATQIILISAVCLAISHLALNTFIPSLPVNAAAFGLIVLVLGWVLLSRKDLFGFLLIVFFCAQFRVANNQGGLFNLAVFAVLPLYLATKQFRESRVRFDPVAGTSLGILFLANLLGLIVKNPMPIGIVGLQFAAFSGILAAFHASSHIVWTGRRVHIFMIVLSVMVSFNMLVSLNQHYSVVKLVTPILGLNENVLYEATNAFGTFGSASMNGQFSMMILIFLIPLLCASASRKSVRFKPLWMIGTCVICCAIIIMANMRAAALLSGLAIGTYIWIFSVLNRSSFRYSKYLIRFAITSLIFLTFFGTWVGIENITADFEEVAIGDTESIFSGEALNRLGPWQAGVDRLASENWLLGYGHGTGLSNQLAWGGVKLANGSVMGGGHFHNLYLALPTLYGWIGALAYLTLFFSTVFRLLRAVRRYSFRLLPTVIALSFLMSCGAFLVDEIKSGNAVHYFNFPMIFFIWFGLALASVRTIRHEMLKERFGRSNAPVKPKTSSR